ncbi:MULTISPECIES: hypothetical protein [Roseateles]|uniref:Uncharacterized protein n=1 Tax=Pelomonas aquatica TaxID=431058 RepID=A0ABU1ZBY1_9BURK|nr:MULTISPECIES: hypothetical protein [Roseateles]KQY88624.1 hypothetical protein ASD35_13815 [Pelomonas sp. Root1444]MDR7297541.1 hypothetical protein [Pelomonas aquatica]
MAESSEQGFQVLTQPSGLAEDGGTAWNVQLTRLLRNTDRFAWGNWTLDPTIRVGALGWFNPTDSQFQGAQTGIAVPALTAVSGTDWHIEQGDVKQTTVGVKFDVPYKDPTTGTEVTVGLQSSWDFGTKGSLTSTGSTYGVEFVEDPAKVMLERYDEILQVAKKYNKATGDKIDQGFGMITKVWLTDGCVNIGSRQDKAEFSITGSVDGVAAMTGSDQSASLKGSYKNTSSTDNIEKRLFPSKTNVVDREPVAYAYEFTSFAGRVIIPRWVGDIPYLNLWLDNGGSYIVNATVTYWLNGDKVTRTARVSGGMDTQITGIPLEATDFDIRMDFTAGATQFLRVANPLNTWELGRGHIKLTGWWPGRSGAAWI